MRQCYVFIFYGAIILASNVISLSRYHPNARHGVGALLQIFAKERRDPNSVYWLKENAEILNVLQSRGRAHTPADPVDGISIYDAFYKSLPDRMGFFPQYYRFFLSIACDLEALGMSGDIAAQLCEMAVAKSLARCELSDLQRAEAHRLLSRRGYMGEADAQDALRARLHRFMDHSASFALPNRKAAYELTHIVFYLSHYGQRDPKISAAACNSLIFAGIIAHMEQNADLMAEVCIALRYAGQQPPNAWEIWLTNRQNAFETVATGNVATDHYHEFLVLNWANSLAQAQPVFSDVRAKGRCFYRPSTALGVLGEVSQILFAWKEPRKEDWHLMAPRILAALPEDSAKHLTEVVHATGHFAQFFSHFSRAQSIGTYRDQMAKRYPRTATQIERGQS